MIVISVFEVDLLKVEIFMCWVCISNLLLHLFFHKFKYWVFSLVAPGHWYITWVFFFSSPKDLFFPPIAFGERKTLMWERSIPYMPVAGIKPQPRYILWQGIEPTSFQLQDNALTNGTTPARAITWLLRRQGFWPISGQCRQQERLP